MCRLFDSMLKGKQSIKDKWVGGKLEKEVGCAEPVFIRKGMVESESLQIDFQNNINQKHNDKQVSSVKTKFEGDCEVWRLVVDYNVNDLLETDI